MCVCRLPLLLLTSSSSLQGKPFLLRPLLICSCCDPAFSKKKERTGCCSHTVVIRVANYLSTGGWACTYKIRVIVFANHAVLRPQQQTHLLYSVCFLAALPPITFATSLFAAKIACEDRPWERKPLRSGRPFLGLKYIVV